MPDHYRFLRSLRLTVGDADSAIRIEDLFVKFRVRREASATPAEGLMEVFNLLERTETRIRERHERVVLEAGYGDRLGVIFDGDVRRVHRGRQGLDRVTRIFIGGSVGKQSRSIFMRSYEGTVSVRDIVTDAVAALGFELGPIDQVPASATERDFHFNGPTRILLTYMLRPLGVQWTEEDGIVHFSAYGQTDDDRPRGITISERTGMIGTPTITDDGVKVLSLLDSRVRIGSRFSIESTEIPEAQGPWKCVNYEHSGDNREGPFQTVFEGRPLSA